MNVATIQPTAEGREWLTLQEVAAKLSLSWRTVRRMCDDGRLTSKRFGRVLRVSRDSFERIAAV